MKLLYADRDTDDCDFFCDVVKEIDPQAKCTIAHTGFEALNILHESQELPDYIFLDETTRLINGDTCLQVIKKIQRLQNIPVIICGSMPYTKRMEEYKKLGADYCYIKPGNFADLQKTLVSVFTDIKRDRN